MVAIGFDQSLSNSALYEYICLVKTKKLYKTTGKCYYQQQYKAILETSMVSTLEGCKDKSLITTNQSGPTQNSSARKLLCQFP